MVRASTVADRLAGTPYEDVELPDGPPPSEDAVRDALGLTARLGEQMFRVGSETRTIEYSLVAVATSLGVRDLEVDVGARSVLVQHAPDGAPPVAMHGVARVEDQRDLHRMVEIHRLVQRIVVGRIGVRAARDQLRAVVGMRGPHPWWVVVAGGAVLAAMISLQAHGTPLGAVLAAVVLVLANRFGWLLVRTHLPVFYVLVAQSTLVMFLCTCMTWLGWVEAGPAASIAAANLLLLLPLPTVVSLAEDAINGLGVMAAVRLVALAAAVAALVGGVVLAAELTRGLGIEVDTDSVQIVALPVALVVLSCAVGSAGNALFQGGRLGLVPVAIGVGVVAGAVNLLLRGPAGLATPWAILVAATVLGVLATVLGRLLALPPTAIVVPGYTGALLPGLDVYHALADNMAGRAGAGDALLGALLATAAIGAGVVLGSIVGSWVNRALRTRAGRVVAP